MYGLDVLHKFNWIRMIARMFEAMAGNFAYATDIQLFLNVINGSLALHSEDACILRYCMATIINAAHQFKNIFASNGYFLVMPSLLRIYSNNQTNELITRTIEYVCKQLYILHRKPFLLQMFGSIAPILDKDNDDIYGDAFKVSKPFQVSLLSERRKCTPFFGGAGISKFIWQPPPLFLSLSRNFSFAIVDTLSKSSCQIDSISLSLAGPAKIFVQAPVQPESQQPRPVAHNGAGQDEEAPSGPRLLLPRRVRAH